MAFAPPVEQLAPADTDARWGNLGDWSRAHRYDDAALALALRLGRAAGLAPGQRVLDAGCGAGDQLRLWVEHFGVAAVEAVERDAVLADRARALSAADGVGRRIVVRQGDATRHPMEPESFDRALSLDAAYFFRSRRTFLRRVHTALRPGGRIALADLVLGTGVPARLVCAVAPAFDIPRANLLTEAGWYAELAVLGFEDVGIDDCTDAVLGGFSEWSRSGPGLANGARDRGIETRSVCLTLRLTGRLAGHLAATGGLGYAIVRATKRP